VGTKEPAIAVDCRAEFDNDLVHQGYGQLSSAHAVT
jgi:hypothetical protein